MYIESAGEIFKYTSLAPEKPGKYLKTPFRRRRSICTHSLFRRRRSAYIHLSGAGEASEAGQVFINTILPFLMRDFFDEPLSFCRRYVILPWVKRAVVLPLPKCHSLVLS